MVSALRKTLAENVESLRNVRQPNMRPSVRGLATSLGIQPMKLARVLGQKAGATVETLQELANAFTLQPWQLLVPGFDPLKPPRLAEPAFSTRAMELAAIYDRAQDRKIAEAAAAFFEIAAAGGMPDETTGSQETGSPSQVPIASRVRGH